MLFYSFVSNGRRPNEFVLRDKFSGVAFVFRLELVVGVGMMLANTGRTVTQYYGLCEQ